ncbi:MAG: alpha/beta hydrolase [Thermoanaerobaculia bacterium]
MPETHLITATVHGRYLLREGEKGLLVGFHGYAENAEIHLAAIETIPGVRDWAIAAVQALHPFYTQTETVVASWMTRMDREEAIADNLEYIRRVVSELGNRRPLVFLGFSQGAAMAYRAAAHIPCDGVIALGGDLPPDVVAQEPVQLPRRALVGRGERDDWFTTEKLEKDLKFLRTVADVTACVHAGGHEWTDEFRAAAGTFLQQIEK